MSKLLDDSPDKTQNEIDRELERQTLIREALMELGEDDEEETPRQRKGKLNRKFRERNAC